MSEDVTGDAREPMTVLREWLQGQAVDAVMRRDETEPGGEAWRWWDGQADAYKAAARRASEFEKLGRRP
jgi:hypothetical protein